MLKKAEVLKVDLKDSTKREYQITRELLQSQFQEFGTLILVSVNQDGPGYDWSDHSGIFGKKTNK